jgi:hypothetical protein
MREAIETRSVERARAAAAHAHPMMSERHYRKFAPDPRKGDAPSQDVERTSGWVKCTGALV